MNVHLKCQEQFATLIVTPTIFSGSTNVHTFTAEFDATWNGYEKIAVFYNDIDTAYYVFLEENKCLIPHEVMSKKTKMNVGVFGRMGEKILTSQIATVAVGQGAVTENLYPSDPTPDIWQQLLQKYDYIVGKVDQAYEDQKQFIADTIADREAYQKEWNERVESSIDEAHDAVQRVNNALSSLSLSYTDMDGGDPFTDLTSGDFIDANGGYPVQN